MKIKDYKFGSIEIGDIQYRSDLIIFPDHIQTDWWRKKGHRLGLEDLTTVFEHQPEILIIGTGFYGLMKVDREVTSYLEKNNIKYFIGKSTKAVNEFNAHSTEKKTVAAIHLTC